MSSPRWLYSVARSRMSFRFILTKIGRTVFTLWLVVTAVFILLRSAGDPVLILLPENTAPEVIELYRERWGLDQPLPVQYAGYLVSVTRGDLGRSFSDGRDALEVVLEHVPKTLELGLTALALALVIGIPAGVVAALRRNTW